MKPGGLKERLLGAVYPPRCVVCRKLLPRDRMICPSCEKYLNHPAAHRVCRVCFLPQGQCVCGPKLYYEALAAPFMGDTPAKYSVYDFKFRQQLDLVKPLAYLMKLALDEREMTDRIDVVTFIPMHRRNRRERGFNQAELLAKALAAFCGLPCLPLLKKVQDTPSQHAAENRAARIGNLLGVYEPRKERLADFAGKRVLLTDDISTTGTTFNEAAKTLLIFGAQAVFCASALLNPKPQKDITE